MAPTTVVKRADPHDVYIGRPSKWGNPYFMRNESQRGEVIAKYEQWIRTQPHLLAALGEIEGKRLGCYCAPKSATDPRRRNSTISGSRT